MGNINHLTHMLTGRSPTIPKAIIRTTAILKIRTTLATEETIGIMGGIIIMITLTLTTAPTIIKAMTILAMTITAITITITIIQATTTTTTTEGIVAAEEEVAMIVEEVVVMMEEAAVIVVGVEDAVVAEDAVEAGVVIEK